MHTTILATFFDISRIAVSMCGAGVLIFLIALYADRNDLAQAVGLDKIVALSNLCFAVPLAVFGAVVIHDSYSPSNFQTPRSNSGSLFLKSKCNTMTGQVPGSLLNACSMMGRTLSKKWARSVGSDAVATEE